MGDSHQFLLDDYAVPLNFLCTHTGYCWSLLRSLLSHTRRISLRSTQKHGSSDNLLARIRDLVKQILVYTGACSQEKNQYDPSTYTVSKTKQGVT